MPAGTFLPFAPVINTAGGNVAYTLSLAAGSYSVTGDAATLSHGLKLSLASGSYAITGDPATLPAARKFTLSPGSYTVTGASASLPHGYHLNAGTGSYAVTGDALSALRASKFTLNSGSYTITGADATLVPPSGIAPPTSTVGFRWVSGPTRNQWFELYDTIKAEREAREKLKALKKKPKALAAALTKAREVINEAKRTDPTAAVDAALNSLRESLLRAEATRAAAAEIARAAVAVKRKIAEEEDNRDDDDAIELFLMNGMI